MKIVLDTLGCKLNQAETELLYGRLIDAGHIIASPENADVYILNTCTVTHTADSKARQLLRKVHRINPDAILVAVGCYPERDSEALSLIDGVILTLGNDEKMRLPEILEESGFPGTDFSGSGDEGLPASRTRTFIKIQDGCSNFCTYCIVPFVRRNETSIAVDTIIDYVKKKVNVGIKEAVLTGTEVGTYYHEGTDLTALLGRILAETDIQRLRLSSLQPDEITPDLLALWENPRLCPHFHLSLQSGSDTVLSRMNRRYTVSEYLDAVSLIRKMVPDVAITTDVIAGFPGETDDEYEETLDICEKAGFARVHVFSYSKRPETAAAKMSGQVRDSIRTQRAKNLGVVSTECAETFRKRFIGRIMDVLWEQQSGGFYSGYTGNYIRVYAKSREDLTNMITPVRLGELFRDGVMGEVTLFPESGYSLKDMLDKITTENLHDETDIGLSAGNEPW
ncbi:MAG: tRNA (N(6)-L-threonylcarbamoyladenosine(37)-C(2))-methylthiotransferase MtaB [Dehalococcoidales bacterium]|nr:tRNA (N(6)-L-threonylcarbamoyladenosine(37)-C(2))-methylthiotransferase MtaB [Dehalococcoidales bacterium]